jgi:transcription antitermination factor NusG
MRQPTHPSQQVWRAYYVKPRHERKVKERLEEAGFTVFCPLVKTKVRWSDRWKKVQKPAMPGYIFALVDEAGRIAILQDDSVFNCVFWNKKPVSVSNEEIEAIRILLDLADDLDMTPIPIYQPGDTVRIDHGPFAGHDLILVDANRTRARLNLPSLGCMLTAKIGTLRLVK